MKETVSNVCKVLALCSQKGGVGKTTSLAPQLIRMDFAVLPETKCQ